MCKFQPYVFTMLQILQYQTPPKMNCIENVYIKSKEKERISN